MLEPANVQHVDGWQDANLRRGSPGCYPVEEAAARALAAAARGAGAPSRDLRLRPVDGDRPTWGGFETLDRIAEGRRWRDDSFGRATT